MLLAGLTEEPGWIRSSFNLTYRVPWEKLIQGVRGVYPGSVIGCKQFFV